MSGTSIPYHLRQNKVIDRYALIDLLLQINKVHNISEYTYIGFGGHSLEDFKYIHTQFGVCTMISLEENEQVYKRQKFNQPISCITRYQQSSSDFINGFIRTDKTIIWLDYTKPKELLQQVTEFQSILQALSPFDIIKITLNANPSALVESGSEKCPSKLQEKRLDILKTRLGDLFPEGDVTSALMTHRNYSKALCSVLKFAANSALEGQPDVFFQPLTIFAYADRQQMLTVTGILLEEAEIQSFLEKTGIDKWELGNISWDTHKPIDIPDFTVKERLYIDAMLPGAKAEDIHKELEFWFHNKEAESLEMLKTYILFYRRSPLFSRILL
jgi:hypothetical protein